MTDAFWHKPPIGALALVPVLIMLAHLHLARRVQADEPQGNPACCCCSAGSARSPLTRSRGRMIDVLPIGFSNYSRFVAPWIEEAIKAVIMIVLFRLNRIGYKLDAVISGFAIGAGFSVVENIFYLIIFPNYGTGTWLVRGLGTAVMHGTTLAILAAIAHEFAERETREAAGDYKFNLLLVHPRLFARGRHPHHLQPVPGQAAGGDARRDGARADRADRHLQLRHAEAQRWLAKEYAEHQGAARGAFGGQLAGQRSRPEDSGPCRSARPRSGKRVRRYWEVLARLVAEAEETLMEEATAMSLDRDQVRCRTSPNSRPQARAWPQHLPALNALLPFSRNDYWEVGELKQRLGRR